MLWLLFEGWLRFETKASFAFSYDKKGTVIDLFIPKSEIGLVTYTDGDGEPEDHGKPVRVEAIQMSSWLAKKLADEHELEYEK